MQDDFEQHINIEQDGQLIDCLDAALPMSRQKLKQLLKNGAVWHETARGIERVRRARKALTLGDRVHVYYNASVQQAQPPEARLIEDREAYSIWFKPAGMLSQGSKWGDHCTIYRWAEQHLSPQRPAFIVHRLDKATSGLMVLAHSKSVASRLAQQFEERAVSKRYHARVEGELELPALPYEINKPVDNRPALTRILSLSYRSESRLTDVILEIKTGRKHQIRSHLSAMGFPVQGDRLYGARDQVTDLQLQCIELGFECPLSGEAVSWSLDDEQKI